MSDYHKKRLSHEFEIITTAFHEAGHVISGLLNMLKVQSVGIDAKIDRDKNKDLGYTNFLIAADFQCVEDADLFNELLIREIYVNYAGLAAEKLFYKDTCGTYNIPMIIKVGSYMDRDRCSELISTYNLAPPGKKRFLFKKKALSYSMRQLEESWSDVKLVAHALFRKKRLSYDQLKSLLIRKSEYKEFWKLHFKKINTLYNNYQYMSDKDFKNYFY